MNEILIYVAVGAVTLIIGLVIGRLIFKPTKNQQQSAQREVEEIKSSARKEAE